MRDRALAEVSEALARELAWRFDAVQAACRAWGRGSDSADHVADCTWWILHVLHVELQLLRPGGV